MGAIDNLLTLFMFFGENAPYTGLDGFICNFMHLETPACSPVGGTQVEKRQDGLGAHAHL